ncbi:hypothetical protein ACFYTC_49270 [Actinomadura nitritigenes]|uniref:hypothetical protein n=1 Tax=Actinomadura nitritigenes TaxID=134602 RepID=UPI0036AEBCFF
MAKIADWRLFRLEVRTEFDHRMNRRVPDGRAAAVPTIADTADGRAPQAPNRSPRRLRER